MIVGFSGKATAGKDTAAKCWLYCEYNKHHPAANLRPTLATIKDRGTMRALEIVSDYKIARFADPLKKFVASVLGINVELLEDQAFKASTLPSIWNKLITYPGANGVVFEETQSMTVRDMLIGVGDGLRKTVHPDIWVNALFANYTDEDRHWLITDMRYPNEKERIKTSSRGGICIRIENPSVTLIDSESETALDSATFDYTIHVEPPYDQGTLDKMYEEVKAIYKTHNG